MIRRSTWFVIFILAGLILTALIISRSNIEQATNISPTITEKTLVDKSFIEIKSLMIKKDTGEYIEVEKKGNDWVLVKPVDELLDTTALENAVTNFVTSKILSELDPAPPGQATGLDNPAYIVELGYLQNEKDTFLVGQKTQTESGYYIGMGDDRVFVVSASGVEALVNLIDNSPFLTEGL
jgi:hypothetical protein